MCCGSDDASQLALQRVQHAFPGSEWVCTTCGRPTRGPDVERCDSCSVCERCRERSAPRGGLCTGCLAYVAGARGAVRMIWAEEISKSTTARFGRPWGHH